MQRIYTYIFVDPSSSISRINFINNEIDGIRVLISAILQMKEYLLGEKKRERNSNKFMVNVWNVNIKSWLWQ